MRQLQEAEHENLKISKHEQNLRDLSQAVAREESKLAALKSACTELMQTTKVLVQEAEKQKNHRDRYKAQNAEYKQQNEVLKSQNQDLLQNYKLDSSKSTSSTLQQTVNVNRLDENEGLTENDRLIEERNQLVAEIKTMKKSIIDYESKIRAQRQTMEANEGKLATLSDTKKQANPFKLLAASYNNASNLWLISSMTYKKVLAKCTLCSICTGEAGFPTCILLIVANGH